MGKLTKAQVTALRALPVQISTWGGAVFAGMPAGIRSRETLHALRRRELAWVDFSGTTEKWRITPAGRAALEAERTTP